MTATIETSAEGLYRLHHGGAPSGTERWRIARAAEGWLAEGEQVWEAPFPYPNTQRYRVALSPQWRVMALDVEWVVRERVLRATHRVQDELWTGRVEVDGEAREQQGNYPYSAQVEFGSPLFNTFTLLGRGFGPGTDEEYPLLTIGPPMMAVTPGRQRCRFLERAERDTPAGRVEAWRWRITRPDQDSTTDYTFWSDREGIVLESSEHQDSDTPWMRLVEYRRMER